MYLLALFLFKSKRSIDKKAILLISFFMTGLLYSEVGFSEEFNENVSTSIEACEITLVNQDIEKRYQAIQKKLEQDFNNGLPKKLRTDLVGLRKDIDALTLQSFDLDSDNSQEMNLITQKTIDHLEKMISLLPQASGLAPKVRTQYVVPFTNINSLKADHQDCLMKIAIADAKSQINEKETESSENIYKKLTSELNQLNKNLYRLETTDVQKFIGLRAQLLLDLESYNKSQDQQTQLAQQLPQILNSVQSEIERLLPGLQLSKKYYSIVE